MFETLLKIPGLDKEKMKNYRPISNLPFISKLIEKVVARCIEEHLEHNDLNDIYQSAYRRGYSTKIALLKGHSDIVEALDEGSVTALIMLDLSAAFDVIDHPILMKRLEFSFGMVCVYKCVIDRRNTRSLPSCGRGWLFRLYTIEQSSIVQIPVD